jgi:hypothetical protein
MSRLTLRTFLCLSLVLALFIGVVGCGPGPTNPVGPTVTQGPTPGGTAIPSPEPTLSEGPTSTLAPSPDATSSPAPTKPAASSTPTPPLLEGPFMDIETLRPATTYQRPNAMVPSIGTWLLTGPFGAGASADLDTVYIEPTVRPQAGTSVGTEWRYFDDRLFSRNLDDYNDLFSYFYFKKDLKTHSNRVAYAHVYIHSTSARGLVLSVGASYGIAAWMNGTKVGQAVSSYAMRDQYAWPVSLEPGWNALLVRTTNQGRSWGFYASLRTTDGKAPSGLTYSVNGPGGDPAIATGKMDVTANDMPDGYLGWPYVWMELTKSGKHNAQASPFLLNPQGGTPPYRWTLASGRLPDGLALDGDSGRIDGWTRKKGTFAFTVRLTDSEGKSATKVLSIVVKDRPTKWFENERMGGLWHSPGLIGTATSLYGFNLASYVGLLKKIGYGYVAPTTSASPTGTDYISAHPYLLTIKTELVKAGIRPGVYFNSNDHVENTGSRAPCFGYLRDIAVRLDPDFIYFDEGPKTIGQTARDDFEADAYFSLLKTANPEIVVLVNGEGVTPVKENEGESDSLNRGDVDVISVEGAAWGRNPANGGFYWDRWPKLSLRDANPKNLLFESWRYPCQDPWTTKPLPDSFDSREWIQSSFSLWGEGHVVDLDVTVWTSPAGTYARKMQLMEDIAAFMKPNGLPSLQESFKATTPMPSLSGSWGYAVTNGTSIYLYVLESFRGKTGVPAGGSITLMTDGLSVRSATLMNTGGKVPFTASGGKIVLKPTSAALDAPVRVIKLEIAGR